MIANIFIFVLPLLSYSPCLRNGFVFDDFPAIIDNPDVNSLNVSSCMKIWRHDFWGQDINSTSSHKSYRPLTTLAFKFIAYLSGETLNPFYFHLANLFLHSINSVLVLNLCRSFFKSRVQSAITAAIFAIHPVHAEAVASCVSLADLAHSFCSLVALNLIFIQRNGLTAWGHISIIIALATLSVLFKEQGIMTVPIICALDLIKKTKLKTCNAKATKEHLKKYVILIVYLCAILYARLWIMDFIEPKFHAADNPAAALQSSYLRSLNYNYIYAMNFWLLLSAEWLCFDWAIGSLRLLNSMTDPRFLSVLGLWALGLSMLWLTLRNISTKKGRNLLSFGILMIFPFLPAANLFFNVGFVIAERNLYQSVLGFALLVSYGFEHFKKSWLQGQSLLTAGLIFTLAAFFIKSYLRSFDWLDEDSLFQSGLRICPNNAKIHYNIAKKAQDRGNDKLAERELRIAIGLYPDYEQALNNLGNLMRRQNRLSEAQDLLRKAVELNPNFSAAWMNLGIVYVQVNELDKAESCYHKAIELRQNKYSYCHFNLGNLYLKQGKRSEALEEFQISIKQNPKHKAAWSNLIMLADELDLPDIAEQKCKEALEILPNTPDFFFLLGNIKAKRNLNEEAESLFLLAVNLKPRSELYRHNLGVLYHRLKRYPEAKEQYESALAIRPDNMKIRTHLKQVNKLMKV